MSVNTRYHGPSCVIDGCEATWSKAYRHGEGEWTKVCGHVYSDERRCWVVSRWSECCAEHVAEVVEAIEAALREDPQTWRLVWRVQTATNDYGSEDPITTVTVRQGDGTLEPPEPNAPIQDVLF